MLLLISVISLFLLNSNVCAQTQEYNGCEDETWTYFNTPHSCYKLFTTALNWTEASNECRRYLGGRQANVPGHLARFDNVTVERIKYVLPSYSTIAWIGLHYLNRERDYGWDGYPGQIVSPLYLSFQNEQSRSNSTQFVYLTRTGLYVDMDNFRSYVCQHEARSPPAVMTCPSTLLPEYSTQGFDIELQMYFTAWDALDVLTTYYTYSYMRYHCWSSNMLCQPSRQGGFWATMTDDGKFRLEFRGVLTMDIAHSILLRVGQYSKPGYLYMGICHLNIYAPPSPIHCQSQIMAEVVDVTCTTDRVLPQGECVWSYKYDTDDNFQSVPTRLVNEPYHRSIVPNQERSDYQSTCSVSLTTAGGMDFRSGYLTLQVKMYPSIEGSSLATNKKAFRYGRHSFYIELPNAPIFQTDPANRNYRSIYIMNPPSFSLWRRKSLNIHCLLMGGNPMANTTTTSCRYANSSLVETTQEGNECRIDTTVNPDMNGMVCTCWGDHLIGRTAQSSITFNFQYAPVINEFKINGKSSNAQEAAGNEVLLTCDAVGDPIPMVAIGKFKAGNARGDKIRQALNGTSTNFRVTCTDNGRYYCMAWNTVQGRRRANQYYRTLYIKCPPSPCIGSEKRPILSVIPATNVTVKMCAVAYPLPKVASFELLKEENGQKIKVDITKYSIDIEYEWANILSYIIITMTNYTASDDGDYNLYYPDEPSVRPFSIMEFSLAAVTSTESVSSSFLKTETLIGIGVGSAVGLLILIIILVICCCRRCAISEKARDQAMPTPLRDNAGHVNKAYVARPPGATKGKDLPMAGVPKANKTGGNARDVGKPNKAKNDNSDNRQLGPKDMDRESQRESAQESIYNDPDNPEDQDDYVDLNDIVEY